MREAPNCAEKCEKRLIVQICAGNGLKCENVRETAKSAISHPPHFIFASDISRHFLSGYNYWCDECSYHLLIYADDKKREVGCSTFNINSIILQILSHNIQLHTCTSILYTCTIHYTNILTHAISRREQYEVADVYHTVELRNRSGIIHTNPVK